MSEDKPAIFVTHAREHLAQRERKLGRDLRRLLLLGEGTPRQRAWAAVYMALEHIDRTSCLVKAAEDE